jgi:methionyl-tRNA formyltransferase
MKFGFVTCVALGLACMEEIYRVGGHLDLVMTLHDDRARKKSGRVYVDEFCRNHGIDLVKIRHVDDPDAIRAVIERGIDWLFIIGWSQIAHADMLAAPKRGAVGMHPTLLPEGRGRAAIPWAILKGLDATGVTLFKMDSGVDTGPILAQEVIPLDARQTACSLYKLVESAHRDLIGRVWSDLVADRLMLEPQDNAKASEWPGRRPEDGIVTSGMSGEHVDRLVRATTHPYPGAFFEDAQIRYRIWRGQFHQSVVSPRHIRIDHNGHLWFPVADGIFEAEEWDKEENT